jgi:hypothetical protein
VNFFTFSSKRYLVLFVLLTTVLVVSFFAASELLIRNKVEPADIVFEHILFFQSAQNSNAVFGDSHSARSFSHPGFANLGYPGDTIATLVYKIKRYYSDHEPGIVILQAAPHMFSIYRQTGNDYLDFFEPYDSMTLRIGKNYFRSNLIDYWWVFLSKGRFESNIYFAAGGAQLSPVNWMQQYAGAAQRLVLARERVALHQPADDFRNNALTRQYREIIEYLVERGARVFLVTFPVSTEYRRFAGENPHFAEAMAFFAELAESLAVDYIDCSDCIADPGLFADEDHLNRAGAVRFAAELVERIERYEGSPASTF